MAAWLSPPKSTMWKMVLATAEDTMVMASSPKKLQRAAITMAGVGFMQRVETTVAMALGASVAPLTMMTPMLSRVTTKSKGLDASSVTNMPHSITTASPSTHFKGRCLVYRKSRVKRTPESTAHVAKPRDRK